MSQDEIRQNFLREQLAWEMGLQHADAHRWGLHSYRGHLCLPCGLDAGRMELAELPDNLFVNWSLTAPPSLEKLPKGLVVGGSLDVSGSSVNAIHALRRRGPRIGRSLFMMDMKGDVWLPNGLVVHNNFHLGGHRVSRLPDGLNVEGHLVLGPTAIDLPGVGKGIRVGGNLVMDWLSPLASVDEGKLRERMQIAGRVMVTGYPAIVVDTKALGVTELHVGEVSSRRSGQHLPPGHKGDGTLPATFN